MLVNKLTIVKINENKNKEEILVNKQVNNEVDDKNEKREKVLLVNEKNYINSQTQNEKEQ